MMMRSITGFSRSTLLPWLLRKGTLVSSTAISTHRCPLSFSFLPVIQVLTIPAALLMRMDELMVTVIFEMIVLV